MNACIVFGAAIIGFYVPDFFTCLSQGKCCFKTIDNIAFAVAFIHISYGLLNR